MFLQSRDHPCSIASTHAFARRTKEMKRFAALTLIALLAACGGDAGPTDRFSGTWTGIGTTSTDTIRLELVSTQNGSKVIGTGTLSDNSTTEAVMFAGTSMASSVDLLVITHAGPINYVGTFVTSDSIAGGIEHGATPAVQLSLKKQ
jgi:hypothetical protein